MAAKQGTSLDKSSSAGKSVEGDGEVKKEEVGGAWRRACINQLVVVAGSVHLAGLTGDVHRAFAAHHCCLSLDAHPRLSYIPQDEPSEWGNETLQQLVLNT